MNRHLIFALCAAVGFSVSGGSLAQDAPADKEAAAKAAKAAKVKFRWGKSLKSAQKQSEETGLPIVLLFTGTSWCGYCVKLEKEVLSKKEFKQGMDGVAIGVKFEFSSSDFSKSKEAKTYKVTGVPAMVVVDAVARLVPGVLNNDESAETESFHNDLLEYPQYSRPEEWHGKKVPEVLLSGNHKKINAWRLEQSERRTEERRPDLYAKYQEKQKVIKKLSAKKRIFIHMMETLSRGLGEVLYAEGKNVLIYLPEIGNAMLNAEDEEHLEKMLPLIPKAVSGHSIVTVTDRWNERVSEILGYHGSMLCSQACYTRGEPLPVRHKDIRQLTVEEVPYVAEHYHLGDEIYVRERIAAGDVFGIYIEGKLCGFIGCHNDGSMGMLYVEDAYRRQGLAASLEGYLINKQREQGMIPYAHIVNGNEASIQLQERLGLNLSDPAIWWLYN